MAGQPSGEPVLLPDHPLPHPAEDLSADDDLLSWVLVDQLGSMPNTKLGVHPQQVKFVGPAFKTDEVLNVVRETVTKGNMQAAMQQLQEFTLFQQHLQTKVTPSQKERFIQHLRRYLLPLMPTSRLEIWLTNRYTFLTGHAELAVFATRPLAAGLVMHEIQGSVVPLPDEWRQEMDIGDDFAAVEAAGEESSSEEEDDDEDEDPARETSEKKERQRAREEKRQQGQRRSDRTKRRDFSIVWSGLKQCYQLFLGPARFLNHDCDPNVELLRQGKHVTFRTTRPVKIGEELTTFYGESYFGKANIECLCLTCEHNQRGGFTPKPKSNHRGTPRSRSQSTSTDARSSLRDSMARDTMTQTPGPSSLRNEWSAEKAGSDDEDESAGPSRLSFDIDDGSAGVGGTGTEDLESLAADVSHAATPAPTDRGMTPTASSPAPESIISDNDSSATPPRRERYARKAAQNAKPWLLLHKGRKRRCHVEEEEQAEADDEYPPEFPRCATCAKPLTDQIWFNGKYFDHCQRCVRHALVYELPWPAHRPQDVQEYPPAHLVPAGFIPRKISTVPLPSLNKAPRAVKPALVYHSSITESEQARRARKLRQEIDEETFFIESLREAAWSVQEAKELAQEAKEQEKQRRREEKRRLDAMRIKGNGVWSRYEYVDAEELARKHAALWTVEPGSSRRTAMRRDPEQEREKLKKEQEMAEQRLKKKEEKSKYTGKKVDTTTTTAHVGEEEGEEELDGLDDQEGGLVEYKTKRPKTKELFLTEAEGKSERDKERTGKVRKVRHQKRVKRKSVNGHDRDGRYQAGEEMGGQGSRDMDAEDTQQQEDDLLPLSPCVLLGLEPSQEDLEDDEDIEDEIMVAAAPELLTYHSPEMPDTPSLPQPLVISARPFARRPSYDSASHPMSRPTSGSKPTMNRGGRPTKSAKPSSSASMIALGHQPIILHIPARKPSNESLNAEPLASRIEQKQISSGTGRGSNRDAVAGRGGKGKGKGQITGPVASDTFYGSAHCRPPITAMSPHATESDESLASIFESSASDASVDARLSSPIPGDSSSEESTVGTPPVRGKKRKRTSEVLESSISPPSKKTKRTFFPSISVILKTSSRS